MTTLDDLFQDFDVAFDHLHSSDTDEVAQRRAGRAALGALFEIREVVRLTLGDDKYWQVIAQDPRGRIAEGIIVIRGRMTHGPLDDLRPAIQIAYPGPKFFPSNYTYLGQNLTWPELDAISATERASLERRDKYRHYTDHVAGHLVLPTLDTARTFYHEVVDSL